ncbi:MAG TPA: type II toxin-antitoxin system prevent-host-death family antitoxin [Thermomicrobiales bacterium]|nr:type II toxin-antitoxin system prevent-host-death family antitoxin [Thermomicrobiales bacterium]
MATASYTEARARFAELMDQVIEDRETVIITRRGHDSVALIAADELESLIETVHLLRSRTNAERLMTSLAQAKSQTGDPTSLAALQAELGLGDE